MVRWMNGLVSGLQNQPRRFDSATHLLVNAKQLRKPQLLFLYPALSSN